jgi:hypothetical protein
MAQNLLSVVGSRKFWMTILSLASVLGILDLDDAGQAELAAQIIAGVSALYVLAVALEDGLTNRKTYIFGAEEEDIDGE